MEYLSRVANNFDFKVFNPFANCYSGKSLETAHTKIENEQKRLHMFWGNEQRMQQLL